MLRSLRMSHAFALAHFRAPACAEVEALIAEMESRLSAVEQNLGLPTLPPSKAESLAVCKPGHALQSEEALASHSAGRRLLDRARRELDALGLRQPDPTCQRPPRYMPGDEGTATVASVHTPATLAMDFPPTAESALAGSGSSTRSAGHAVPAGSGMAAVTALSRGTHGEEAWARLSPPEEPVQQERRTE